MAIQLSTNISVQQLIECIPNFDGSAWSVEPLHGGSSNRCYLLSRNNERLVFRLNQAQAVGVHRARELAIHQQLALRGMAPIVVAGDPKSYLLTEYVAGPRWALGDTRQPDRLRALGKYLRVLHEVPVDELSQFPAFDLTEITARYWADPMVANDPALERIKGEATNLLRMLGNEGWLSHRACLCHHDPIFRNLFGDSALQMIDWEFSAVGNPLLDLGLFVSYHDLPHDLATPLYESYFGICSKIELQRMASAIRVAQLLELLWLISKPKLPVAMRQRLGQLRLIWS